MFYHLGNRMNNHALSFLQYIKGQNKKNKGLFYFRDRFTMSNVSF